MLEIQEKVPLAPYTTFRVGGNARFFVAAKTIEEAQEACEWAQEKRVPVFVLGGGSNVLVSDKGFEGLVIKMELGKWEIVGKKSEILNAGATVPHPNPLLLRRGNLIAPSPLALSPPLPPTIIPFGAGAPGARRAGQRGERESQLVEVYAEAGVVTAQLAGECARAGLSGFTWAVGVPGTIGGAVRGNAGASGGEMAQVVTSVTTIANCKLQIANSESLSSGSHPFTGEEGKMWGNDSKILNLKSEILNLNNAECKFGYRHSVFKERPEFVVLSATLRLTRGDEKEEIAKMKQVLAYRNATQPKEWPNSGCVFKNFELEVRNEPHPHPWPSPSSLSSEGEGIPPHPSPFPPRGEGVESSADELRTKGVPKEFLEKGRIPAGWLIEHAGGQSLTVGGARISERHCNFLQNAGGATAEDIRTLIAAVKEKVYTRFGVTLQEEVQYVGW